jgi:hypothetical protein
MTHLALSSDLLSALSLLAAFLLWEITASWLALASHVTMIALLIVYHDAKVSAWTEPWTFNFNVAFFITIIEGACLSPVASCLGQLKWRSF